MQKGGGELKFFVCFCSLKHNYQPRTSPPKYCPHPIIMTSLKDSNTFVAGMMQNKIYSERGKLLFCMCVCSFLGFWGFLFFFFKSSPSCTEPGCSIKALSVVFLSVFLFCLAHSPTREKGVKQWRLWPAAVTQYFRTALSTPDINFTPQLAFTHLTLPYV